MNLFKDCPKNVTETEMREPRESKKKKYGKVLNKLLATTNHLQDFV